MKLTENTRLRVEDFQKQRDWIGPLLEAYNSFLAQSIRLFNRGLLFADNIIGLQHDFEFTFQTQALSFPVSVSWPYTAFPPKHLYVTYATENEVSIPVTVAWKFTDARLVQITSVYKFASSVEHTITASSDAGLVGDTITFGPAVSDLTSGGRYRIRVRVEP